MSGYERSIEISQNIHNFWQLGDLDDKRKIQKLVFPEGIKVDTKNRIYLTSKVNSLFLAKSQFQRDSEGANKKLPTVSDEESFVVAGVVLLSAFAKATADRESVLGCFTKQSLGSLRSPSPFSLHGLSSKLEAMNEKSPERFAQGFL